MSSYEEWCPVCKSPIVMVTRGIPSMGRCMNGHTSDRRDTLRREPEKVEALPTLSAAMELPEIRALVEAVELLGLRRLVAGWNGEGLEIPYTPHPPQMAVRLPASARTVYAIDAALAAIKETKT